MKLKLLVRLATVGLAVVICMPPRLAQAATGTCNPADDYGRAAQSVNIPATGTYTIWSRLATDTAAHNSYMLQVDDSYCFTVGSSTNKAIPVYAANATTHFANDSSNWFKTDTSGAVVQVVNLTAGTHQIVMIGNQPNVMVDRLIFTQDTSCTPTGVGNNCAVPPDVTPPTLNISAPADNATISTPTNATVNATDNVAITSVAFYVDGVLKASDTSSPFSYSLDPATLGVGPHKLTAKAYDAAGNNATSGVVNVTVPDAVKPTVAISNPAAGSTQTGTIVASATASDNLGVKKVEFYTDASSTPVAIVPTGNNGVYSASIDTANLSAGSHTLTAKAYDAASNVSTASSTFTVSRPSSGTDTTSPVVTIDTMKAGTYVNKDSSNSKSYRISTTASDTSGIKQVVIKVDGTVKATLTTAPYAVTLDLSGLACGQHTITATATDRAAAPNSATSSVVFGATYAEDIVTDAASCTVDYHDLSALAGKYNQRGSNLGRADIDGNGVVDYHDLSALAGRYNK